MKKHVKLYNAVFDALHADDKFVLVCDMEHDDVVRWIAAAIGKYCIEHNTYTNYELAEYILASLQGEAEA